MTIPLTILSGYLGAGKTTLVNHLLRHASGQKLAILVNEFGELPIDEDLIEAEGDDLIALAGGCVCCSYGDDLITGIAQLSNLASPPDHIILEASGVALPGSIGKSVSLINGITLQGIIVLVDAELLQSQLSNEYISDTIERQLAAADLVILNKTDLADHDALESVRTMIREHSTTCSIFNCIEAKVPPQLILSDYPNNYLDNTHGHVANLNVETLTMLDPINPEEFANKLAADKTVLRAKGHFVSSEDNCLYILQLVGSRYRFHTADTDVKKGIIVIKLDVDG